jgi:predicted nuclease of predicted toxin-antitoxin system
MARFYSNENFPLPVVTELRNLGHDVLTSHEAGQANAAVPEAEVLAFATSENRILLSHNRRHFLKLHTQRTAIHAGIVLCTFDPDFAGQALRIHETVAAAAQTWDELIRVNRPASSLPPR